MKCHRLVEQILFCIVQVFVARNASRDMLFEQGIIKGVDFGILVIPLEKKNNMLIALKKQIA